MNEITDITKWCYCNLDLIEENKEIGNKSIVLVAGASSSGKSFVSSYLKQFLTKKGIKSVIISTDDYNKGIAKNVFQIVDRKYYNNTINNEHEIVENIKNITKNTDFNEKLNKNNLILIKKAIKKYISVDIDRFLKQVAFEFENIDFDQKNIYDLKELSSDLTKLLSGESIIEKSYSKKISERNEQQKYIDGKDFDVIIVEGIYALDNDLIKDINKNYLIKNFIDCKAYYLFLRRMIRDMTITDCKNTFIFKNYIDYVAPAYQKNILPLSIGADFVFENNMTFDELRQGDMEIQTKFQINHQTLSNLLKYVKVANKCYYKDTFIGGANEQLLRLREISNDGITFQPFSLIYKGEPKVRHDKKLIRPVHVLLTKDDFDNLGLNTNEILSKFKTLGITATSTRTKQRYTVKYNNQNFKIDFVNNKIYLECDNISGNSIFNLLNNILGENNVKQVENDIDTNQEFTIWQFY